jgi:hypothetical protein
MRYGVRLAVVLAVVACGTAVAAPPQEAPTVASPTAIHEQTALHLKEVLGALAKMGTPETPFDFVTPGVSGPVVVLQGFTANGALKNNAEAQVKKLGWVVHVVNEIEYLAAGSELRRMRSEILATLERMVPQAFPENHSNIRIKVTKEFDVTLMGVVDPGDKKRFEAAVEQVKHLELVGSVTNHVVETTG